MHNDPTSTKKTAHWEPMHSPAAQALPVAAGGGIVIALVAVALHVMNILQLIPH